MAPNILVIRLSSLGDIVLTAPVYRSLKARWPDCKISLLVKPGFAPALEGHPCLDGIIPFEGVGPALARIRSGGFTHLLDLHANLRSTLLRVLSRVPATACYRKASFARRLFVAVGLRSPSLEKHTVERYLEALAAWGVPPGPAALLPGDWRERGLARGRPSRILVVQTSFLGDCLLTIPLLKGLKGLYPGAPVSVLAVERTADAFRGCGWADEVIIDDKRGADAGLAGTWRLARRLGVAGFDLAVIPHRSLRSALLARLANIPRRVGFDSSAGRLLLTDLVPFAWLMHDLERNLALLRPLGAPPSPDEPSASDAAFLRTQGAPDVEASMRRRLEDSAPGGKVVGVHPGSAWATKRWLPERFAELCRRLAGAGWKVILVGGKDDRELCARIARESGAADWSGKTTLRELRSLMSGLSLFVTNDSGPMHVATASGVPTLAIFGPTTRELGFFPYGPGHRVLESDLRCRPCALHGGNACPEGHFLCMRLVTVDQVWSAAQEMLKCSR